MSDQYLGEIRMFGCNFAPVGWALCNGQILPISQNTALFSLLGTSFGGDGKITFALPNLQGTSTLSTGQGAGLSSYTVGEQGGQPTTTLILTEMPLHTHGVNAVTGGTTADPKGLVWGNPSGRPAANFFANVPGTPSAMNQQAVATSGGTSPHNNLMPYLVLNFCIALNGAYPPRS